MKPKTASGYPPGTKVQCDFGYGPREQWKKCLVLSAEDRVGLFGGTYIVLHVKATTGETMEADMWRDGWDEDL